jgi:hypothetical protein
LHRKCFLKYVTEEQIEENMEVTEDEEEDLNNYWKDLKKR